MKTEANDLAEMTCTTEHKPEELKQWQKDLNFQMGVFYLIMGLILVFMAIWSLYSSK
jgi:hypothetical protein